MKLTNKHIGSVFLSTSLIWIPIGNLNGRRLLATQIIIEESWWTIDVSTTDNCGYMVIKLNDRQSTGNMTKLLHPEDLQRGDLVFNVEQVPQIFFGDITKDYSCSKLIFRDDRQMLRRTASYEGSKNIAIISIRKTDAA